MELWIAVTIGAAFFQTLRFMLQKLLSASALSSAGATFARFFYSAPLVVVLLATYFALTETAFPATSLRYWIFALSGGLAQILATLCVVMLFKTRNFAVGITFKKTEVIQTALVGFVILGESISQAGFAVIMIGLIGVLLLSEMPEMEGDWFRRIRNQASHLGVLAGFLFAISGVCYRGASLEIDSADPLLRAGVTLACVTSAQLIGMALWLRWFEPGQISAVWAARRSAAWIGLTSMVGSFCWFTAFTLQNVAYVNALGQIELIFSLIASVFFFKERITKKELAGLGFLTISILGLILVI
ncbi:MAG: EamA family transporter [Rhodobacterales bacterium]|jgi:drug/metabolite transporter (DMT)-like permease